MKKIIFIATFFSFSSFLLAKTYETIRQSEIYQNQNCQITQSCSLKSFEILVKDLDIQGSFGRNLKSRVYLRYTTDSVDNLLKFGIVQFIRGCMWESTKDSFHFGTVREFFGRQNVKFIHPQMVIDSIDVDPLYNSWLITKPSHTRHDLYRWNSVAGSYSEDSESLYYQKLPLVPVLYVRDTPGSASYYEEAESATNTSLEFISCVYKIEDIPLISTPQGMGQEKALKCFNWQSSNVFNHATKKFEKLPIVSPICNSPQAYAQANDIDGQLKDSSTWQKKMEEQNRGVLDKLQWSHQSVLDGRVRSQTVAIVGAEINPANFLGMIDQNKKEIPDNSFDDDGNGYVDDYNGLNLFLGNGTNYGTHNSANGLHETRVASMVALISAYDETRPHPIKILPITVDSFDGKSDDLYFKRVADAIDYAVLRGARVINMSFGISETYRTFFKFIDGDYEKSRTYLQNAIDRAFAQGVIILGASSNDIARNQDLEKEFPANLPNVLSISGISENAILTRAFGKIIKTATYSENLYLYDGGDSLVGASGTSYATPIIAAYAAIMLAKNPEMDSAEVGQRILQASVGPIIGRRKISSGYFLPNLFLKDE
ncbi:MAG TPA: S8 family serine peptidase [Bacteriovoracaceae bacterium]|nr:S8 family serine peptidase [Bacteriovoracaceae bacterium]